MEWINVEIELPKCDKSNESIKVIVSCCIHGVKIMDYYKTVFKNGKQYYHFILNCTCDGMCYCKETNVTHWMPLPQPPKT